MYSRYAPLLICLLVTKLCSALPNLVVASVEIEENATEPGDGVHVEWVVRNIGDSNAVGEWYDLLTLIESGGEPTDAPTLSHGYFTAIQPGQEIRLRRGFSVPAGTSLGDYKVRVEANQRKTLVEASYVDNFGISEVFPVTFPNLIVTDVSAEETFSLYGLAYRVTWKVKNASTQIRAVGDWWDAVYLTSTHPSFQEVELRRNGYFTVLHPGDEIEFSRTAVIPEDVWQGEYCLEVRTDVNGEVSETVEWDNSAAACEISLPGSQPPAVPLGSAANFIMAGVISLIGVHRIQYLRRG